MLLIWFVKRSFTTLMTTPERERIMLLLLLLMMMLITTKKKKKMMMKMMIIAMGGIPYITVNMSVPNVWLNIVTKISRPVTGVMKVELR